MFTIGEISSLVKITPRMLRYYEKMGIIIPEKIDKNTGYRYYSGNQIPLLFQISYLRDMGLQIREIADYIDFSSINEKKSLIKERIETIQIEMLEKQNQTLMLNSHLERLEEGNSTFTCEETVVKQQEMVIGVTLRKDIDDYSEQSKLWEEIGNNVGKDVCLNPSISIYHSYTIDEKIDIEVGFLDRCGEKILPSALVASVMCKGAYYLALPEGEQQCIKWILENGYEIVGKQRTIGHKHMMNEENADEYLNEIQFPIRKVR